MKTILATAMCLAAITATAEEADCLIINTADGPHKFAISEVKEITFADNGITVQMANGTASSYASGWQGSRR